MNSLNNDLRFFVFKAVITIKDIRPRLVEEADARGIKASRVPTPPMQMILCFKNMIYISIKKTAQNDIIIFPSVCLL